MLYRRELDYVHPYNFLFAKQFIHEIDRVVPSGIPPGSGVLWQVLEGIESIKVESYV